MSPSLANRSFVATITRRIDVPEDVPIEEAMELAKELAQESPGMFIRLVTTDASEADGPLILEVRRMHS